MPHRKLNDAEAEELKDRLGKNNVDEYWICDKLSCRHVRTGFKQCAGSGGRHIRLPVELA
ncbi:hypothetical protein [Streptomyces sp. NPDC055189]